MPSLPEQTNVGEVTHVLIEGYYDDYYVPITLFDPIRFEFFVECEGEDIDNEMAIRQKVNLLLYNEKTGTTYDNPEFIRETLKSHGKWVDKLSVSLVWGW